MALALEASLNYETESDILSAIEEHAEQLSSLADLAEQTATLPEELVTLLKSIGVFRMTMPKDWGGLELSPMEQLRIIERLAMIDASMAWCVMIGCDSGFYSGFIDQNTARSIYTNIDAITASALTATGEAHEVENGYTVKGRWPFVSGCRHADVFLLGCKVFKSGEQLFHPNGVPVTRQCFVPSTNIEVIDTWDSTGLRGSGSHDVCIDSVFVPDSHSFTYQDLSFFRNTPLYNFPLNIIFNFASVPLGIAQKCLDTFIQHSEKPSRLTVIDNNLSEKNLLRDEVYVQNAVAKATANLNATRLYLYDTMGRLWGSMCDGQPPSPQVYAEFQMINAYVYNNCTDVVESLYKARGGSAVYRSGIFDSALRDMLTINQHVMNSERSYSMAGRVLMGMPPEMLLL